MRPCRGFLCALCVLCAGAHALDIHRAGDTVSVFSPLYNEFLGSQDTAVTNLTSVPVAWLAGDAALHELDCSALRGRAVFVSHEGNAWTWAEERQAAVALERCAAVLVVSVLKPSFRAGPDAVGISFHTRDASCCRGEDGPSLTVTTVWHGAVGFVKDALDKGEAISLTLTTVDENPWDEEVYDKSFFFALGRVFLAVLNFGTCALALHTLVRRILVVPRKHSPDACRCHKIRTVHLINFALFVDAAGCLMRGVYCALGPVFCNAYFTTRSHMFLLNVSFPIEVVVVNVAIWTFRKLGSLSVQSWMRAKRRMFVIWVFAVVVFVVEMVAASQHAKHTNLGLWVMLSVVAYLVFVAVAAAMFVVVGQAFLRQLKNMHRLSMRHAQAQHHATNRRMLRIFTLWVLCDTVPLVLQLGVGVYMLALPSVFFSPVGFFVGFFFLFLCFSLCSLCQVLAFSPRKFARLGDQTPRHTTLSSRFTFRSNDSLEPDLQLDDPPSVPGNASWATEREREREGDEGTARKGSMASGLSSGLDEGCDKASVEGDKAGAQAKAKKKVRFSGGDDDDE